MLQPKIEEAHVLIVDDEIEIAEIIQLALTREGFKNITICHTGEQAIQTFMKVKPDIVLLDIMLPDQSGYEVFKNLRNASEVPILFVSAKDEEVDRLVGFAIGADDYITKPFSPKEVVYRVKARLKKTSRMDQNAENQTQIYGDLSWNKWTGEIKKSGNSLELTAKEHKLLTFFMEHPNRILSKEVICSKVWGEDFFGFDNTISVHIRKIRKKIEKNPSEPKYIQTVIGLGYKFVT